jgi:hypothetical protein
VVLGRSERTITTNVESCGRMACIVDFSDLLANITRLLQSCEAGGGPGATVGRIGLGGCWEKRRARDAKTQTK